MKKTSDDLFDLIKSLTKKEKSFVKNYLQKNSPGKADKYVHLFNLIDSSQEPGDEKIKIKSEIRYYSQLKGHLYTHILEAMQLYFKGSSPFIEIHNLLIAAEILKNKSLQKQSLKTLEKAREIATTHENLGSLLEIYSKNIRLIRQPLQIRELKEYVKNQLDFAFETIEKYKNIFQFTNLENQALYFIRTKGEILRHKEHLDELNQLINHPLLRDKNQATTLFSKKSFSSINSVLLGLKNNYPAAYKFSAENIRILETRLDDTIESVGMYFANLVNAIGYAIYSKKWTEAKKLISKLKNIQSNHKNIKYFVFQHELTLELLYFNRKGEFGKAISFFKNKENEFNRNFKKLDNLFVVHILENIAESYFLAGNYKESLVWLNKIFSDKRLNPRKEVFAMERIFSFLLYYESKDYEALEFALNSLYRYLSYNNILFGFEKTMIYFFRKLIKAGNENEKDILFKELYAFLKKMEKNPLENFIFSYFDYLSWVESKVKKTELAKLIKHKSATPYKFYFTE